MNKGLGYGILAYLMWGFFPLYWRLLNGVPASEILIHRIIWSFVFCAALLLYARRWDWLRDLLAKPIKILPLALAAVLLAANWFVYVWAISAHFVVETSLGYFINPLVNVLLGVIFLKEILRPGQWLAISIAGLGVLYLTVTYGSLPWIALFLAFSFGFYALLKKRLHLGAVQGLGTEMSILVIPALFFLATLQLSGQATFGHTSLATNLLFIGSGAITAIPLILFAAAARRVPLSTLGILQYIAPTIQFLIGVYIFGEPFSTQRLVGFCVIWVALGIYTAEGLWQRRSLAPPPVAD